MMQAELLDRLGVDFEVWAHTASDVKDGAEVEVDAPHGRGLHTELNLEMYPIKLVTDRWNDAAKEKLQRLTPHDVNLDGHTVEFYRKRLDMSAATDRILMYYTDGDMPYFNYSEELHILKRELQMLRKNGHHVVGVGFQTDSPKAHGLPTVRVDTQEDIGRVVEALKKLLM
jgi:hypothetical protein